MVTNKIVAIALTILTASSFALPIPRPNRIATTSSHLDKRVYSVPKTPDPSGDGVGAWPQRGEDTDGAFYAIFYCFDKPESADRWQDIVIAATSKWAPALSPVSGMHIQLHPGCKGDPHVTCSEIPDIGDYLIIRDGGEDDEDTGDKESSSSSTGYDYEDGSRDKNFMNLRGYTERTRDQLILDCAHEFGHTMGLGHELQRPDRGNYVGFVCDNLIGSNAAKRNIQLDGDDDPDFEGLDEAARSRLACTTDKAGDYFPEALSYVTGDKLGFPFSDFETDDGVDYFSIMIYSSWQAMEYPLKQGDMNYAVVWRLDENQVKQPIYQGGDEDPTIAGPSSRDIARIGYLYPKA